MSQPTPTADRYAATFHNVALFALLACPALALLPPRKLDFYTFGLAGTAVYSANFLSRERTGRSLLQSLGSRPQEQQGLGEVDGGRVEGGRGVEAWKRQREQEIRDDLDVGKGFGEMITDQIWEVWNWGKGGGEGEE